MKKQDQKVAQPVDPAALTDAMLRASAGDAAALAEVRGLVRDPRALAVLGDLSLRVQTRLLGEVAGTDLVLRDGIPARLAALRRELTGPDPTPLEALLVDRVAINWLHLYGLELRRGAGAGLGPAAAAHYERAVDGAHRRYLAAIKALATVRKLALPAIQVNLAHNQVNVGSAGAVAAPAGQPVGGGPPVGPTAAPGRRRK